MIDIQLYKTLLNNAAVELKSISRSRYFNDGKNFTMSIPLQSADSDVIFTEALVAMRELIAHVEELKDVEARAEAAEARVAELEAEQRWIPVSERLPEEWQNVLVIGRDGCIFNWLYTSRMVQPFILHWTHWMPFKPPKPEEK